MPICSICSAVGVHYPGSAQDIADHMRKDHGIIRRPVKPKPESQIRLDPDQTPAEREIGAMISDTPKQAPLLWTRK